MLLYSAHKYNNSEGDVVWQRRSLDKNRRQSETRGRARAPLVWTRLASPELLAGPQRDPGADDVMWFWVFRLALPAACGESFTPGRGLGRHPSAVFCSSIIVVWVAMPVHV